jgi:hypothetical protein
MRQIIITIPYTHQEEVIRRVQVLGGWGESVVVLKEGHDSERLDVDPIETTSVLSLLCPYVALHEKYCSESTVFLLLLLHKHTWWLLRVVFMHSVLAHRMELAGWYMAELSAIGVGVTYGRIALIPVEGAVRSAIGARPTPAYIMDRSLSACSG